MAVAPGDEKGLTMVDLFGGRSFRNSWWIGRAPGAGYTFLTQTLQIPQTPETTEGFKSFLRGTGWFLLHYSTSQSTFQATFLQNCFLY